MPQRYVNDAFTLEDGFGTTVAGDQVARMALEVETPFTLGVTGKWGSGKTSVLRRAFVTLGGNPVALAVPLGEEKKDWGPAGQWEDWRYNSLVRHPRLAWDDDIGRIAKQSLSVWYSPWQHQGAANPLIALLLEIRAQFSERVKAKKKIGETARRAGLAGLALLDRAIEAAQALHPLHALHVPKGTAEEIKKAWHEAAPDVPKLGDGQRFHLLFDDAIGTLLSGLPEQEGRKIPGRLIVFIDDLDRCEESVVVQLLESIKLYLGSPRCVFVLAIDEAAVLTALERHWKGRSEDANREYLEKLFQAIVPVPAPRAGAVKAFLEQQIAAHHLPDPPACADLILELLEPNPRKLKNFVNSACAGWGMLTAAGAVPSLEDPEGADFAKRFLLLQYLRAQHKPVWRLLERQPWALRVLGKVLTGTVPQKLPAWVSWEQQRMLEHLFVRAFAHILGHEGEQTDRHRFLPIAEAVDLANQRIDRKRSDDCFARYFRDLIGIDMDLPDVFLGLPPPAAAAQPAAGDG
jgi:KAP-like P-loop domain-containing protein